MYSTVGFYTLNTMKNEEMLKQGHTTPQTQITTQFSSVAKRSDPGSVCHVDISMPHNDPLGHGHGKVTE